MTALRRPAPATRGARRALFFVTLLALLIVLLNIATGYKISALVRDVVAPISMMGGRVGVAVAHSGYFSSRGALEAQITALQNEVQQDALQAAAYQVVQQENSSLSALTHIAQTTPGLAAPVTSSVVSSPYGTFTIGAGAADAIVQGSLVLTSDGFVIGKVAQVQTHQSLVDEIFASGTQTDISIDGAAVVAVGNGGEGEAQVPHGVTVATGDPAIAPEFGDRAIGTVAHVDSDPANAQQAVYISLPAGLSSLQYVYVVTP